MTIASDVRLGDQVVIPHPDLVNMYGCTLGNRVKVGPFVEIQANVAVGDATKISSHAFICSGVTIEDQVFIGHGVVFTNDLYPRATNPDGSPKQNSDWRQVATLVKSGAAIGSNATILAGVTIGRFALVGAGSVVTHDVVDYAIVAGVPARQIGIAEEGNV